MSDTNLQISEIAIEEQLSIIENSDLETPTEDQCQPERSEGSDLDAPELDLALEDELIIEDFTLDGICGVY